MNADHTAELINYNDLFPMVQGLEGDQEKKELEFNKIGGFNDKNFKNLYFSEK